MTEGTPPLPVARTRRSIKTKMLFALLALSLLPLILFVVVTHSIMVDMREDVKATLIRHAKDDLRRMARSQATIANAMLDKVEVETRVVAFFAEVLLRNPAAFGGTRSYSAAERPANPDAASVYTLAPRLSLAAAKPELDATSNLDELFVLIKKGDPILEEVYYGMQSGAYRLYPWNNQSLAAATFTLQPAFAQQLSEGGGIPTPLLQAFKQQGINLSLHAGVSTIEPGNGWLIQDAENKRIFSVRKGKSGLDVHEEYDPTIRPWYINAVGRNSETWTKYADWQFSGGGGKFVFEIGKEFEGPIGDKVSPSLVQAFATRYIALTVDSPISVEQGGGWMLQDVGGIHYVIRREDDKLKVYSIDTLTCSKAVLDPAGHVAGVVGMDITMDAISNKIIRTAEDIEGYAFLLGGRGELIDQEKANMYIPEAGGSIRSRMTAGQAGIEYVPDSATYVAYAPIPSVHSFDGKSFWSVGVSMPEAEITRLADRIQYKMVFMLELLGGICVAMMVLVIVAAIRISKGITGPIMALGAGVTRIGSGDLDYRLDVRTHDEIEDLANAFNKMTGDLKSYIRNLRETTVQKERFESELRMAHDIQMSFLKKIFPAFPHRSDFSLYATIVTAREVGGDLYDFVLVDETRLVFYVGDVSDKGVPASLVMAMTMTLMKRACEQPDITPAEVLRQVNVALSEDNVNCMFVTLFIGILNLKTGELSFSNAGHNPPIILGADGECRFLTLPDGLVLGVMAEAEYRNDAVQLEPGDMIVTYTDGVTEAMSPEHVLYSDAHLRETVARLAGHGVADTVGEIVTSVRIHAAGAPQSDDIAVLALMRS